MDEDNGVMTNLFKVSVAETLACLTYASGPGRLVTSFTLPTRVALRIEYIYRAAHL